MQGKCYQETAAAHGCMHVTMLPINMMCGTCSVHGETCHLLSVLDTEQQSPSRCHTQSAFHPSKVVINSEVIPLSEGKCRTSQRSMESGCRGTHG